MRLFVRRIHHLHEETHPHERSLEGHDCPNNWMSCAHLKVLAALVCTLSRSPLQYPQYIDCNHKNENILRACIVKY